MKLGNYDKNVFDVVLRIDTIYPENKKEAFLFFRNKVFNYSYNYRIKHIFIKEKLFLLKQIGIIEATLSAIELMPIPDEIFDKIKKLSNGEINNINNVDLE